MYEIELFGKMFLSLKQMIFLLSVCMYGIRIFMMKHTHSCYLIMKLFVQLSMCVCVTQNASCEFQMKFSLVSFTFIVPVYYYTIPNICDALIYLNVCAFKNCMHKMMFRISCSCCWSTKASLKWSIYFNQLEKNVILYICVVCVCHDGIVTAIVVYAHEYKCNIKRWHGAQHTHVRHITFNCIASILYVYNGTLLAKLDVARKLFAEYNAFSSFLIYVPYASDFPYRYTVLKKQDFFIFD